MQQCMQLGMHTTAATPFKPQFRESASCSKGMAGGRCKPVSELPKERFGDQNSPSERDAELAAGTVVPRWEHKLSVETFCNRRVTSVAATGSKVHSSIVAEGI